MERVDINRLIADTLLLLSHELMEQEVDIEQDLLPLPFIFADREQMRQIFLNLILNATQAMPGGGKLRISTAYREGGASPNGDRVASPCLAAPIKGAQVKISFRDEGKGIPDPVLEKLFEPFFTTKEEGIGLGLSITKRIVEDHRGRIEVETAEGKGSTFSVILPVT
jgi:signal transduction histidine kinase